MAPASNDRPNIRQVAAAAGVSHMTVSRVLNEYPGIAPATRERVLRVISELNFRPNSAARALASQRSRRIGILIESAVEFGPASTQRGIELAARENGFTTTSIAIRDDDRMTPRDAVELLVDQGIDALCVVAPRSSSVTALREITISVPVLVIKAESDPTFLTLSVDQEAGTRLVLDHLVALGHRDVLHITGPLDWLDARGRERGFRERARSAGLVDRATVVGDWTSDFGYDFARTIDRLPEYTAIFAANDEMALGVIHGLHENGIRVPHDISVAGFDDVPLARHFLPPLTTVRQDFHALGIKALEVLHAALEKREIPHRSRIPAELVVRESTVRARH